MGLRLLPGNVCTSVCRLGIALLLQQVTPVAFQVEAARRRFRLAHHCLQFLQGEVSELVCGHDFIVVQALRQIQGGGQGGTALMLQGPEIGLEETLLPLILLLEDKSQVLTVVNQILQPAIPSPAR